MQGWFYSREYIHILLIFRKARPSFFRVLHSNDEVKLRLLQFNFKKKNSVQYDTITRENLKVCKNKNRWSSDMKEIWNVKIVLINGNKHKK